MTQLILPGTAAAADVKTGKNFSAGLLYGAAGSMPDRGAPTFSPGTGSQAISAGYYSGGQVNGDANLVSANILSGKSIFGVAGSLIQGKQFASGTVNLNASLDAIVTGLAFRPSQAWAYIVNTDNTAVWGGFSYVKDAGDFSYSTIRNYAGFYAGYNGSAYVYSSLPIGTGNGNNFCTANGFSLRFAYGSTAYTVQWYAVAP